MYIIGIGGLLGHDSNAALFRDDCLIASSQEERFTRIKHDSVFPSLAINNCLSVAGIRPDEVEVCVFSEKPFYQKAFDISKNQPSVLIKGLGKLSRLFEVTIFEQKARKLFPSAKFFYSWHHASHAVAGLHSSPFKESTFLCIDGKSENANASIGSIDQTNYNIAKELEYGNGLGMFYSFITNFLGFTAQGSEYKIMGLAPYGQPRFLDQLYSLATTDNSGAFRLKFYPGFNPTTETPKYFNRITEATGINHVTTDALNQDHVDLAASLQKIFELEVLKMAKHAKEIFPESDNLIFCGGCAQNCVAAGILRDSGIFKNVFTSPIGGDMGTAVGAGIDYMRQKNLSTPSFFKSSFYFGPEAGRIYQADAESFEVPLTDNIYLTTARLLADGKICGWVQGGMELGARALGARSILATPLDPEMQTTLNLKIKFRESFRPFAPAILEEDQSDWFDSAVPSYYMQYTAHLKEELRYPIPATLTTFKEKLNFPRCKVPSIVHVDFSARIQTISEQVHPDFYHLLKAFKKITGVPILINTSFNVNGQPIVRTADEAWDCFKNTGMDYLIIGHKLYRNPNMRSIEAQKQWLNQFEKYSK